MFSRLVGAIFLFYAAASAADEPASDGRLTFLFGPYVYHYHDNASHENQPWLTSLEWEPSGSWLEYGVAYFRNSFSQPSMYAYAGKRWFRDDDDEQGFYLKVTAGPMYGYRGKYEHKVPFNHNGLAWAIVPGIGYQYRAADVQFVFLGSAALMIMFGYDLPK